jgi:5-deoxy-D-glucuronate isomerase
MFKPSLTVHKSPKGKLTVLVCSEDANKAIDAYKACTDPGEVQLIQRGHFQKQKKIRDIEAEKKRKAAEAKKVEAAKKKEEAEAKKAAAAEAKKVEAAKPKE